jgi:hydrogenase expression/formation protein HypE
MTDSQLPEMLGPLCPLPIKNYRNIVMGHGSGGMMTRELIEKVFHPHFSNPSLLAGDDFAEIPGTLGSHLVVSTDAHIVSPLFFPGGDIGRLAVSGTVNDISVSGGTPLCLTASFIIEEGFSIDELEQIVTSMADTAREAGVPIVAGDTKVVERGKADGVFISTAGVAFVPDDLKISGANAIPGDAVLISGTLGDHGIAVMSARGDLGLSSSIRSDVAPLNHLIQSITSTFRNIHVLRDPTRGGLATTLNEIAIQSAVGITIREELIPVQPEVNAACEMLGFDPLYVANEGKVIVILPEKEVESVLRAMRDCKYGENARLIGVVHQESAGNVLLSTRIGGTRLLSVMSGEMLPRIC